MSLIYFKFLSFLYILYYLSAAVKSVEIGGIEGYPSANNVTYKIIDTIYHNTTQRIQECPAKLFTITTLGLGYSSVLIKYDSVKLKVKAANLCWAQATEKTQDTVEYDHLEGCLSALNQFKISSLEENTRYLFFISFSTSTSKGPNRCYIMYFVRKKPFETNYSLLAKPDFQFIIGNSISFPSGKNNISFVPTVKIEWLPCGENRNCEEEEVAGNYFFIKYKMLDSRQEWRTYEYDTTDKYLYGLLPGRLYEVVVTSVSDGNVYLESDSDPQEVFIMPGCTPVRSVKIITLTNSSIVISWKLPKQCEWDMNKNGYTVSYRIFDNSPIALLNYSQEDCPFNITLEENANKNQGFAKISDLTPGTSYSFFIIPWRLDGATFMQSPKLQFGFEYRIDYTASETNQANLPLAKPTFIHKLNRKDCFLLIHWLPCGPTFDCKNTAPGLYFLVKYRKLIGGPYEEGMETQLCKKMVFLSKKSKYEIWVESRDEYNRSASSDKEIISTSKCTADQRSSTEGPISRKN